MTWNDHKLRLEREERSRERTKYLSFDKNVLRGTLISPSYWSFTNLYAVVMRCLLNKRAIIAWAVRCHPVTAGRNCLIGLDAEFPRIHMDSLP